MAFAVSTIIGVAGLGLAGASAIGQYSAAKDNAAAQEAQLAANQEHARLVNESNLKVQADNLKALEAQQNVEKISQQQMNLDATRKQREVIRSATAARSQALAAETAAGATGSGSSTVGGIDAGISGRAGVNLLGIFQNQEAGNAIFGYHQDQLNAYKQAAIDGYVPATAQVPNGSGTSAAMWQGIGQIGSAIGKNADTLGKIGTYFGSSSTGFGDPFAGYGGSSSWSIGGF